MQEEFDDSVLCFPRYCLIFQMAYVTRSILDSSRQPASPDTYPRSHSSFAPRSGRALACRLRSAFRYRSRKDRCAVQTRAPAYSAEGVDLRYREPPALRRGSPGQLRWLIDIRG